MELDYGVTVHKNARTFPNPIHGIYTVWTRLVRARAPWYAEDWIGRICFTAPIAPESVGYFERYQAQFEVSQTGNLHQPPRPNA